MTSAAISDDLRDMSQVTTTQAHVITNHVLAQANLGVGPQPNASTLASSILYFMRMKPSTFNGTRWMKIHKA